MTTRQTRHTCPADLQPSPIVSGSPRQVAWAQRIYADLSGRYAGAPLPAHPVAEWWIAHRDADYDRLWQDAAQIAGPFTGMYPRYGRAEAKATLRLLAGNPWRMLDTETTGITRQDEPVQIAIVDGVSGSTLFESLIRPADPERLARYGASTAAALNGISDALLRDAPTLAEVWPELWAALTAGLPPGALLAWNVTFDLPLLRRTAQRQGLPCPPLASTCAMRLATAYYERDCWLSLDDALLLAGLSAGGDAQEVYGARHTALADARLASALVRRLMEEGV